MKNDDEETLKRAGITTVSDEEKAEKILEESDILCTLQVVKQKGSSDESVGLHFKWGDSMDLPSTWDMDNLTPQQSFCLLLLNQIEQMVQYIAASNTEYDTQERRKGMRAVSEDNMEEIMEELANIDKDKLN